MTMPEQLPKKHALIIQAVDNEGSRQRADRVLRSIIDPACAATGYEAVRANDLQGKTIVEPIISPLNTHPLVIADLAVPPWNPNVLMEIGFRLANGRPIVLLADTNPQREILPLQLRNVRIHIINSKTPGRAEVDSLIESIKQYSSEVNAWESDYPTIEFSIFFRGSDGGRFIFANDKAARAYGLEHPDDLIGRPINEVDPRLRDFFPSETYYKRYGDDQMRILGEIVSRQDRPKTAIIPLRFTKHRIEDQNDKIYWPVLTQYRYVSRDDKENADIVMRVVFIDVSEWDAMKPRPRESPEVLTIPELFQEVRRPIAPQYDIFLSYNSKDSGYVSELYHMLLRCGLRPWYDVIELGGAGGLTSELIKGANLSRIFVLVLGKDGLGQWQHQVEMKTQLLNVIKGPKPKPVVLLLLPGVEPAWKRYLDDSVLEMVLEDRLRVPLPPAAELHKLMTPGGTPTLAERVLRLALQLVRSLQN
jgi:PAS domain-containing protein